MNLKVKYKAHYTIWIMILITVTAFVWKSSFRPSEDVDKAEANSDIKSAEVAKSPTPYLKKQTVEPEPSSFSGELQMQVDENQTANVSVAVSDSKAKSKHEVEADLLARRQAAYGGAPLERTMDDIPESIFREQLQTLSPQGQAKALASFNRMRIPLIDVPSLRIGNEDGVIQYACYEGDGHDHSHGVVALHGSAHSDDPVRAEAEPATAGTGPVISQAAVPVATPPAYNSKPGAPFTVYLDFNGGRISGTEWNVTDAVTEWDFAAWSTDADASNFSDSEQLAIFRVWQRVAEDYAPFDINVSTDVAYDPDSNGGRSNNIAWVFFGATSDTNGAANPAIGGGVAYTGIVGLNNFEYYQPAWVNTDGVFDREDFMAAAASHEFGHNLGLSHDGENPGDGEYYNGHGTGLQSWGPIMGSGYYSDTTQWSMGEYRNSTSNQDDLALVDLELQINAAGSAGYSMDDHGDTRATATALALTVSTINAPATTYIAGDEAGANEGIIERNTDIDYWSFYSESGAITISATPYTAAVNTNGHNLDIKLTLYDASGTLLATADPDATVAATIAYSIPTSGTYYLAIEGSGWGDPVGVPTGWTDYGSIGQYFLSGSVFIPNNAPTDIALSNDTIAELQPVGSVVGILSSIDPNSGDTAAYSLVSGTGDADNAEFQLVGTQLQTAAILDYEAGSTRSVRIRVTDSQSAVYEEVFTITLTDVNDVPAIALVRPSVGTIAIPTGVGLLLDTTASDDNFGGSSLTLSWSVVGVAPGTVTWDNQDQADTGVTFSADGYYVLRLTANDGSLQTTQDFYVTVGNADTLGFQQEVGGDGLVVIETENYESNTASGDSWTSSTAISGYEGGSYMTAGPDDGTLVETGYTSGGAPRMDYTVNFSATGIHYVWLRGSAADGNSDSVHASLNDQVVATSNRLNVGYGDREGWIWTKKTMEDVDATIDVATSGKHTFNLYMREDGVAVDRILLTTNASYDPSISEPAESVYTDNDAPLVDAGASVSGAVLTDIALDGTVQDDGNPSPPSAVTTLWTQISGPGSVTFGNDSLVDTTVSSTVIGTYVLRLIADDGSIQTFDEISVDIQTPADNWRDLYFNQTDNTGNAADDFDYDGDGLQNLLERAFGANPTAPDLNIAAEIPPYESIVNESSDYLAITYRRISGGSGTTGIDYTVNGMTYTVEYTTDLAAPWESISVTQVGAAVNNGNGTETVTVRLNSDISVANSQFIRLKVVSTP